MLDLEGDQQGADMSLSRDTGASVFGLHHRD
jgi:hypothetical protein